MLKWLGKLPKLLGKLLVWLGKLIDSNEKELSKLKPLIEKINSLHCEGGTTEAEQTDDVTIIEVRI